MGGDVKQIEKYFVGIAQKAQSNRHDDAHVAPPKHHEVIFPGYRTAASTPNESTCRNRQRATVAIVIIASYSQVASLKRDGGRSRIARRIVRSGSQCTVLNAEGREGRPVFHKASGSCEAQVLGYPADGVTIECSQLSIGGVAHVRVAVTAAKAI